MQQAKKAGFRTAAASASISLFVALTPAGASAAGDPLRAQQWNLDMVHADAAHRSSIGTGALVAVLDSGVQASHPDLVGSIVEGPDFVDGDQTPDDQHGHGTNIAGIIAAHKDNAIGMEGAAPGAKILAIRILDAHNNGYTDHEAAGIDAAVAAGAHVINLSLNPTNLRGAPDALLVRAIDRAAAAGVVIVAAAGNDAAPLCNQPRVTGKVLCVGALDRNRKRCSYSNYGKRVNLMAPGGGGSGGDRILSTRPDGAYRGMRGTSQATAHVAAAAALLVSLGLRGAAIIDRLQATATPLGRRSRLGNRLLNMSAAVAGLGRIHRGRPRSAVGAADVVEPNLARLGHKRALS